jgi:LacI family transcriptional regulator
VEHVRPSKQVLSIAIPNVFTRSENPSVSAVSRDLTSRDLGKPRGRVTQSDIARAVGVHNTTVSLALRNSPLIPETTRQRIQALATEMGYYPDPALRALVAYRNGRRPQGHQQTIAYLTNWKTKWGWRDLPEQMQVYVGARGKAAEFGCQLEHFWLGEPGLNQLRLSGMLFHRGISGAILAAHRGDSTGLRDFDWSRLSAIKIGPWPVAAGLHRVMPDYAGIVRLAIGRLQNMGCGRIGLVLPRVCDELADEAWSSAFLLAQVKLPVSRRVPILLTESDSPDFFSSSGAEGRTDVSRFAAWFHCHRPEAVLGFSAEIGNALQQLRHSVPEDVSYVDLALASGVMGPGVCQNRERIGEVAAEMLLLNMQQNVRGLPAVPTTTLVEGRWMEGNQTPAVEFRRAGRDVRIAPVLTAGVFS